MIETVKQWKVKDNTPVEIATYLTSVHEVLCERITFMQELQESYFQEQSFEQLYEDNKKFYKDVDENYHHCYADPRYTKGKLPFNISDLASAFYYEAVTSIRFVYQKDEQHFIEILEKFLLVADTLEKGNNLAEAVKAFELDRQPSIMTSEFITLYDPENFNTKILKNQTFDDLRYLFRYGIYVSETEIAFAQLMNKYQDQEIQIIANQMVDGYLKGFVRHHKDMKSRSNARIVLLAGLEKIGEAILHRLNEYGYEGFVGELVWKNHNSQAIMDYEKVNQIYGDEAYYQTLLHNYKISLQQQERILHAYQGNVIMVSFGQVRKEVKDYQPYYQPNYEARKTYEVKKRLAFEHYVPKAEISYTGMAFPVKDISSQDYEKIFHDIMRINQMDPQEHENMQAYLISILDQADYVEIKGWKGNETNIRISLHELHNPQQETNFVNCGADVNIPVGEVYTTPKLQATTGKIHLKQIRIAKVQFKNVKIEIENGFTTTYTCENTEDEEENYRLMEDVIFHHRKTLPIGEFALGTNTFAYALAKKDGILHQLHTLIYEKLGPHIALGDTCFAWAEDIPLYSQDQKLVIAKDNEVSIQRKVDPTQAYVNMHYDLTIPYDEIGCISAYTRTKEEITIVRNGLFVLEPLLSLNQYLRGDDHETKSL